MSLQNKHWEHDFNLINIFVKQINYDIKKPQRTEHNAMY